MSPDEPQAVASQSANHDDILKPINNNASTGESITEMDDLMLAKMLQEQEQAMYMLAGGEAENALWPRFVSGSQGIHADDAEDSVFGTDEPAVALTEPGAKGADEEELSDEALALRLQQEELAAQNARFMQMAGIDVQGQHPAEELNPAASLSNSENLSYEALSAIGDVVGTVSKGLPAELIAKLPVQTAAELRALSDENNDCAVCRMEYDDGDMLTTLLPCKHTYHSECIGQWLTLNKVCPMCNTEVTLPSDE